MNTSSRKIMLKLLTQQQLEVIETNARTFGEFKEEVMKSKELASKMSNFKGVQFIEKRTKAAFGQLDDAVLPATECVLFVMPMQTKSGNDIPVKEVLYSAINLLDLDAAALEKGDKEIKTEEIEEVSKSVINITEEDLEKEANEIKKNIK
jgi:hypothetical protein